MIQKQRVLFLCTGNSVRSQMAEAFLRHYAGDRFEVFSAGYKPREINPMTIQVMEEAGHPLTGQTSKSLQVYLGHMLFQYLITVCNKTAEEDCPTSWVGMNEILVWSFEDPLAFQGSDEEKLAKFRQVRDQIEQKIRQWITEVP